MEAVNIYPNPAIDVLTIEAESVIESISVFNFAGSLVLTETSNSFSVSQLPSGIYTLTVKTENGISVNKFTKE
jgi:hypothetical protein